MYSYHGDYGEILVKVEIELLNFDIMFIRRRQNMCIIHYFVLWLLCICEKNKIMQMV